MKIRKFHRITCTVALAAYVTGMGTAGATELVYYPLNPSFGGNPLNGTVFLNSAITTNKHTDPDLDENELGFQEQSPLEQFNDTLERAILSRMASAASSKIIGSDGQFVPGRLETDNFTIDVTDTGNGVLTITTIDKLMGGSTTFQVNK